ncbi:ATPase, F1/V1/A1 complex, alpha/beta subunit [Tanacetum coccineum]
MLNKKRSSKRVIRVPMRFGDSITGAQKRKTKPKNSDNKTDDGYCEGGMDEAKVGKESVNGDGFVGDFINESDEENVNVSSKINANDMLDNVNASFDLLDAIVKMNVNVGMNACKEVKGDDACDMNVLNNDKSRSNDVRNRKFTDMVLANKLDNKLLEIPTEISDNGSEFHDEVGMDKVVNNGPWMVNNKPLFVQKWRVGMCLDRAEPSKLLVWVKLFKVPMEVWSVKGISALASSLDKPITMDDMTTKMCLRGEGIIGYARVLIELDAGKVIKDKINVVYKGSAFHGSFTKIIEVEYAWMPSCCNQCKVFGHDDKRCKMNKKDKTKERNVNGNVIVDNAFKVVHNRKMNNVRHTYYNRWNGNNGMNGYQKNIGKQVRIPYAKLNNKKVEYMKKKDEGKEKVNVTMQGNKKSKENDDISGNSELNNKESSGEGRMDSNTANQAGSGRFTSNITRTRISNRFTLLESLVNEKDLIPTTEQRKVIDEFLYKKIDASESEMSGWNAYMKRYFKDMKELFHVAKELEKGEDVIDEQSDVENYAIKNEVNGVDMNILL